MSRKDEIFESDTGLISIAGGKLTGFRKMAERIVDLVAEKIEKKEKIKLDENKTHEISLSGGPFKKQKTVRNYQSAIEKKIMAFNLTAFHAKHLVSNYGRNASKILEEMQAYNDEGEVALARAEAWYCINFELTSTLLDFFNRRTGRLYFDLPGIEKVKDAVIKDFKSAFNWNKKQTEEERVKLEKAIKKATTFKPETTDNKSSK